MLLAVSHGAEGVKNCDLAEGLEWSKSVCMQRGNTCAGICWLHGGFSVGHWIKSYSCFHLLSKIIKTVEEERNRYFLFDWCVELSKLVWLEQLQEEKKKVTQVEAHYILIFNSWVLLLGTKTDMNSFIPMQKSDSGSSLPGNNIMASLHWKYIWRKDYIFGWEGEGSSPTLKHWLKTLKSRLFSNLHLLCYKYNRMATLRTSASPHQATRKFWEGSNRLL